MFVLPSALYKASLLAKILRILSSQRAIKSESLVCNFCILPYSGFSRLVIPLALINSLSLLVFVIAITIIITITIALLLHLLLHYYYP